MGDHHTADHEILVRALHRRGLRNCRLTQVGDAEEGYADSWDNEPPKQLNSALANLNIEYR